MNKSNWRDELYLDEVAGTVGKTVTRKIVRQGIKVGGKRGGRAAQGAVAAGKTATQHAMHIFTTAYGNLQHAVCRSIIRIHVHIKAP